MPLFKKDKVFHKQLEIIKKFSFNEEVVRVFDNMIQRSVPNYGHIHQVIIDIIMRKYSQGIIYDLGCSTGTTIALIDKYLQKNKKDINPEYIGIDNSQAMLAQCAKNLKKKRTRNVELINQNLKEINLKKSSFIIMNYTLQFIPKKDRHTLLSKVYKSLSKDGIFILSEKIISPNRTINNFIIDLYYDFKRRNGYSDLEISQKREALENTLIPLTPEKQIQMLKDAGFKKVEMIFRWYNFSCYIGIK